MKQRKDNRLKHFDYSSPGSYFITICVKDRKPILSTIIPNENVFQSPKINLTQYGEVVDNAIKNIPSIYPVISLEKYVIMPEHLHLLLRIRTDENGLAVQAPSIDRVIKQFKSYVTKQIGFSLWQRTYFDHIVRGIDDYNNIWEYINNNPINRKKHNT